MSETVAVADRVDLEQLRERLDELGHRLPAVLVVLLGGAGLARNLQRSTPVVHPDAALFMLAGDAWLHGGVPFANVFDIKPPAIWELHALLALVTPSRFALAAASATLGLLAFVATALLVGQLVRDLTDSGVAALVAGSVVPATATITAWSAVGLRAKWLAVPLGLAAWLCSTRGHHRRAAVAAGVAAACWQLMFVFVVGTLVTAARDSRRAALEVAAVVAGVAAIVVAPVVASGAGGPMLVQSVLVPIVVDDPETPLRWIVDSDPRAWPVLVLVPVGGVELARRAWLERALWPGLVLAWTTVVVALLDRDGIGDLWFPIVVAAVGLGLLWSSDRIGAITRGLVVGTLAVGVAGAIVSLTLGLPVQDNAMMQMLWAGEVPAKCHIRLSTTELRWLDRTGSSGAARTCLGLWEALARV